VRREVSRPSNGSGKSQEARRDGAVPGIGLKVMFGLLGLGKRPEIVRGLLRDERGSRKQ
jgi:hypothetical protein